MKKKWYAVILIYIALLVMCLVAVYAVPSVKGLLEKTYIAEYGKLDVTDNVSAYIVRDEVVYVAAQSGKINRLAEENKLVKAKARVVEITPDNESADEKSSPSVRYGSVLGRLGDDVKITDEGYTQEAGYISYYIDGAESQLRTDNIDNLLHKDFKSLTDLKAIKTPVQECEKGDPLFKVTKNSKWYLVFYIDKEAGKKYTEGRTVKADIAGTSVDVKVVSVREGPKAIRVVLSCKMFFDEFFGERSLDTVVTVASADGLLIRDSSIVERDGQKGVLVKNKIGEIKFKPVAIKADDGTTSVAYADIYVDAEGNFVETIGTYDEIIAEPTPEEIKALDDK